MTLAITSFKEKEKKGRKRLRLALGFLRAKGFFSAFPNLTGYK